MSNTKEIKITSKYGIITYPGRLKEEQVGYIRQAVEQVKEKIDKEEFALMVLGEDMQFIPIDKDKRWEALRVWLQGKQDMQGALNKMEELEEG